MKKKNKNFNKFIFLIFLLSIFSFSCKKKEKDDNSYSAALPEIIYKIDTIKDENNRLIQTIEYSGGKVSKILYYSINSDVYRSILYTYTNQQVNVKEYSSNNKLERDYIYYLNTKGLTTKYICKYYYEQYITIDSVLIKYDAQDYMHQWDMYVYQFPNGQVSYIRINFTVENGNYTRYDQLYGSNIFICQMTYDTSLLCKGFNQFFGEIQPEIDFMGRGNRNLLKTLTMIYNSSTSAYLYQYKFNSENYVSELIEKRAPSYYPDSSVVKFTYKRF